MYALLDIIKYVTLGVLIVGFSALVIVDCRNKLKRNQGSSYNR